MLLLIKNTCKGKRNYKHLKLSVEVDMNVKESDDVHVDQHVDQRVQQPQEQVPQPTNHWVRRCTCPQKHPMRYSPDLKCSFALLTNVGEPTSIQEAREYENPKKWRKFKDKEMEALHTNETWELVDLPTGKNIVGVMCQTQTTNTQNKISMQNNRSEIFYYFYLTLFYMQTLTKITTTGNFSQMAKTDLQTLALNSPNTADYLQAALMHETSS